MVYADGSQEEVRRIADRKVVVSPTSREKSLAAPGLFGAAKQFLGNPLLGRSQSSTSRNFYVA